MKHISHLKLAHEYWSKLIVPGDIVIDATCGNGQDTLFLAQTPAETVYAIDIQPEAIESSKKLLHEFNQIKFILRSHETFPNEIQERSVKLIVYNLGYLPGGDKSFTTVTATTLKSIENAQKLIQKGGMISITCYPGHEEGEREEEAILEYCSMLNPKEWNCCHHRWINRKHSPSLLIIYNISTGGFKS